MTEFQEKLLQTFKFFAQFCKKNNLTYYAAYGTCLGAVRHHGFIPWDDDMDVYMMRSDYERLISLREQLINTNYRVSDIREGNYPYLFGKFYSTDATIWEWKQFPFIVGPWIDIFPVDEWEERSDFEELYERFHLNEWNYRKALSTQTWSEITSDMIHLRGYNGMIKLVKKCVYVPRKKHFFNQVINDLDVIRSLNGSKYKAWTEVKQEVYDKEWFASVIEMPFEDVVINVPAGYSAYLTHRYGDYMTLPPEEKRVSTHKYYFIDLHKTLTVEQIRSDKTLAKNEAETLSFKVLIDEIMHRKGFIHH